MISALIVDDEPLARANLRLALAAHPRWRVAAECAGPAEAREAIAQTAVDVAFLDVRMPRQSGIELARSLVARQPAPILVFVTAFDTFAVAAFELHALDYLLKPFDDARFAQTVRRAEAMLAPGTRAAYREALDGYLVDTAAAPGSEPWLRRFSIRSRDRLESIDVGDVQWISAAGNYVELHLARRVVLHRVTLSQLALRLDPAMFMRVHRSTIVRRDQCAVLRVDGDALYALHLTSGETVSVSSTYLNDVRRALGDDRSVKGQKPAGM